MMDTTYKQLWIESIQKRHNDLLAIADWELFKNWEAGSNSTILINGELRMALDILYSSLDPNLCRRFLDRAWGSKRGRSSI